MYTKAFSTWPSFTSASPASTGPWCCVAHSGKPLMRSSCIAGGVPSNRTSTWTVPVVAGSMGVTGRAVRVSLPPPPQASSARQARSAQVRIRMRESHRGASEPGQIFRAGCRAGSPPIYGPAKHEAVADREWGAQGALLPGVRRDAPRLRTRRDTLARAGRRCARAPARPAVLGRGGGQRANGRGTRARHGRRRARRGAARGDRHAGVRGGTPRVPARQPAAPTTRSRTRTRRPRCRATRSGASCAWATASASIHSSPSASFASPPTPASSAPSSSTSSTA